MTAEEYNQIYLCCRNIINKWYAKKGVWDKPSDWEDKAYDAAAYIMYLMKRNNMSLDDLRCKLVTYCYMPCIKILLNEKTKNREMHERTMEIFEDAAVYESFEDDLIEKLTLEGY